jgi:hypothetical protein
MNILLVRGHNVRLSKNFMSNEGLCKCGRCSGNYIDSYFLGIHQGFRTYLGRAVHSNSWCRCPYWNQHEGGVSNSYHLTSSGSKVNHADDFWVDGLAGSQLLAKANAYGLYDYVYRIKNKAGQLTNAIHVDTGHHSVSLSIPVPLFRVYVVKKGDVFSVIAKRLGVSVDKLKSMNPQITNINVIDIGNRINY